MNLKRTTTWALAGILVFPGSLFADDAGPKLNVAVVEGHGGVNSIRHRKAQDVVVHVTDEAGGPVANAAVVFQLPTDGPSGTFPNGSTSLTVVTDGQGAAIARSMKPNSRAGKLEIHVSASSGTRTGRATLVQFNMDVRNVREGGGKGKVVAIAAVLGAAAAGGAVAGLRKANEKRPGSAVPPVITLTPGAGSVGPPQ